MLNKNLFNIYISPLAPKKTSLKQKGLPKEKILSVIFDIYGTLFISGLGDINTSQEKPGQNHQIDELLKKFSIKKPSEFVSRELFFAINKKHAELKGKGIDFPEVQIDRIWMNVLGIEDRDTAREFAAEYEMAVNPAYPMPHLKETLQACVDKGIVLGIISNAQFYTNYLFELFLDSDPQGIGFDPDLVLMSYEYEYAKPSTFLFNKALKILEEKNIPASSTVYIGNDMLKDIFPSQKLGFQTALFAGDKRSLRLRSEDPRCKDISPDIVITDLIQLLDYL
jgi:putative hydrolase of the HAD superfamily